VVFLRSSEKSFMLLSPAVSLVTVIYPVSLATDTSPPKFSTTNLKGTIILPFTDTGACEIVVLMPSTVASLLPICITIVEPPYLSVMLLPSVLFSKVIFIVFMIGSRHDIKVSCFIKGFSNSSSLPFNS